MSERYITSSRAGWKRKCVNIFVNKYLTSSVEKWKQSEVLESSRSKLRQRKKRSALGASRVGFREPLGRDAIVAARRGRELGRGTGQVRSRGRLEWKSRRGALRPSAGYVTRGVAQRGPDPSPRL